LSVEAKHKAYATAAPAWLKVRDFVAGGERVKKYIKTLPGHDEGTVTAFKDRTYYLPAIARSVDAFVGLIMNPEPVVQAPEALTEYLDDVSFDGEPAKRMIGRTVREVTEIGRCAVIVDYPQAPNAQELSVADAEAAGLRAYARFYRGEDVLDWRVTQRGGERVLSFLKLKETIDQVSTSDEWAITEVEQIRVLDLVEGKYRQRLYQKGELTETQGLKTVKKEAWTKIGEDIFPQANGAALDQIPAVVFGPDSLDVTEIAVPPVLEMVEVSSAWLNNSALMEWTLMWVSNPTPVFINLMLPEGESVKLGSSQGISLNEGGDAKFLALGADGVGALRQAMEDKRRDMAAVGARLLSDETTAQISRDTAIIQRAGEHSVLANIATTVASGWARVLGYLAIWAKADGDISVTLNTDFVPQGMTSGELSEMIAAVQAGQLSSRDLFALLQKRGVIRPDKSYDEHQDELDEDGQRVLDAPLPDAPANDQQQQDPANPDQTQDEAA
jgi:hypothetical protein